MKNLGTLYVIAAPSGGGKTSLVDALLKSTDNLKVSISYTTRPKRPSETPNVNYHFITEAEFQTMVAEQAFLEHALVHGHHYGTAKKWIEEQLAANVDVILEIDWQGARQIHELFPQNSVSIFILPPSRAILEERLTARKQDQSQVIKQRLAVASSEIAHYREFDYLIVNDVFATALADLQAIIRANRLRQSHQTAKYAGLLADLAQSV